MQGDTGNYYVGVGALGTAPLSAGTSFNGDVSIRIIWNGSVVPLVGADNNGNLTFTITNGAFPTNTASGGLNGFADTSGNLYFPFETGGTNQPSHINDNPASASQAPVQTDPQTIWASSNLFKVKRQTTIPIDNNPSSSQIVPTLSSVQFQAPNTGTSNDFVVNRSPNSGDHYIMLFHGPSSPPIMAGTSFNGNLLLKIVWNGAVVPLVGADSNGCVTVNASNGVFPTSYTADGNSGFVSTDGNAYFPFQDNGTDQPDHVHDNPVRNIFEFLQNPPQTFIAQNLFRVARQTYTTTGGSSGNSPTGSYSSAQIPKLIVFADARAVTASETYGMKVFKDDGTAAFDNRKKPLIIKQVTAVAHQSTATNNFSGSGLSARNASGPTSTWSTQATPHRFVGVQVNSMPTNAMFYYATVTQVHQQVSRTELEEECDGIELKGNCLRSRRTYTWRSTYWNFYRGAIQRFNDTTIYAGYINVEFGSYHSRTTSGGFFGFNTGNSSGSSVGKWPWDSAQINNAGTGINTLLIADATNYI